MDHRNWRMHRLHAVALQAFLLIIFAATCSLSTSTRPLTSFSTVQKLNAYFEQFFSRSESLTAEQWSQGVPSPMERSQMRKLIKTIYEVSDYGDLGCTAESLRGLYLIATSLNVFLFKENFCVIHEKVPTAGGRFARFWGYAVIASRKFAQRNIHHSAAHFESDGDVCNQAASVFESTKSRSLVVAGASRFAVPKTAVNECQSKEWLADAAHNNATMFQVINEAIHDYETVSDAVFVQWHGMAETSCSSMLAFVSAGAGGSSKIYDSPGSAANVIVKNFNDLRGVAFTPRTSSDCGLLATTNVFGRYVNGVPPYLLCTSNAVESGIQGKFVHIEQKRASRDDWQLWKQVIETSFPERKKSATGLLTSSALLFVIYTLWL